MSSSHFDDFKQKYTNLQVELNYNQNLNFVGYSYFFNRKLIGLTEIVMWKTQPEVLGTPCTIFPHTMYFHIACIAKSTYSSTWQDRRDIPKEEIFGFFLPSEQISYSHRVYPIIEENNAKRLGTEYYTCTVYVTCNIYPSSLSISFTLRLTSGFKKFPNLKMSIKSWLRFLVTIKISAFSWLNGI